MFEHEILIAWSTAQSNEEDSAQLIHVMLGTENKYAVLFQYFFGLWFRSYKKTYLWYC